MILCQKDGQRKVQKRRETAHDPKPSTLSVKTGEGSIIARACIAADEVIADRRGRMNCKVYRTTLAGETQPNVLHSAHG